jgi:outer membrane protein OmpA-like peptidoglycan-associated protein
MKKQTTIYITNLVKLHAALLKMTKTLIVGILILVSSHDSTQAQEPLFSKPSWWIGGAVGANYNFFKGESQQLNTNFTAPLVFHDGLGMGVYAAPLLEYYAPNTRFGAMLQVGYDNRSGTTKETFAACGDCPTYLTTHLSYVTIEPSLRIAPFKNNFYIFGGPRFAFNMSKSFTYDQKAGPRSPEIAPPLKIKGDLSNVNKTTVSMQIGAGYDVPVTSQNHRTQFVISPFISFQPYWGQMPRSVETMKLAGLRMGAAFKFGCGHENPPSPVTIQVEPEVKFVVTSPKNIPIQRRIRETFPLRNYVFFDIGSTEIPDRYEILTKDQVKDFKEDQLEMFAPKKLSGRSKREMTVYYNVLNILGDRMGKNPFTVVKLVGSSEKGPADGQAMAESVKQYLMNIFGIDAGRISIEGRDKPLIPSQQPGGTKELDLLRAGDRRVTIESNSPALLMEFQSGSESQLKPVEITDVQEAPLDSYVSFHAIGAQTAFSSWFFDVADDKGNIQTFGPYTQELVSIPGKTIMGTRLGGEYKVTMLGLTKGGNAVKKVTFIRMALWTPPKNEEGIRYSVIFEFNESKTIALYEKYLSDVVAPKIPKGATVIIHGYTDVIGDADNNQKLSLARANDVMHILNNALTKKGRKDARFEVYGFGEDEKSAPFDNNYPEERFYNRTVLIDIIPKS